LKINFEDLNLDQKTEKNRSPLTFKHSIRKIVEEFQPETYERVTKCLSNILIEEREFIEYVQRVKDECKENGYTLEDKKFFWVVNSFLFLLHKKLKEKHYLQLLHALNLSAYSISSFIDQNLHAFEIVVFRTRENIVTLRNIFLSTIIWKHEIINRSILVLDQQFLKIIENHLLSALSSYFSELTFS